MGKNILYKSGSIKSMRLQGEVKVIYVNFSFCWANRVLFFGIYGKKSQKPGSRGKRSIIAPPPLPSFLPLIKGITLSELLPPEKTKQQKYSFHFLLLAKHYTGTVHTSTVFVTHHSQCFIKSA